MHILEKPLKPLGSVSLTTEETKILRWIQSAPWEAQPAPPPNMYKAKVPEFFNGARLYRVQGGSTGGTALGALDLLIKKLEHQGVLTKQQLYPVITQNNARFLVLKKAEMDNLGVGQAPEEE